MRRGRKSARHDPRSLENFLSDAHLRRFKEKLSTFLPKPLNLPFPRPVASFPWAVISTSAEQMRLLETSVNACVIPLH